jgi:hypothetical protein
MIGLRQLLPNRFFEAQELFACVTFPGCLTEHGHGRSPSWKWNRRSQCSHMRTNQYGWSGEVQPALREVALKPGCGMPVSSLTPLVSFSIFLSHFFTAGTSWAAFVPAAKATVVTR